MLPSISIDPFDGWSEDMWDSVKSFSKFATGSLLNPSSQMGEDHLSETIFAQLWPLGSYIALLTLISVLSAMILTLSQRLGNYLPKAIIAAFLTGSVGGALFWQLNQSWLSISAQMARTICNLGPEGMPTCTEAPIFPFIGKGVGPWLFYLLALVFVAVFCGVIVIVVGGGVIMGGGIVIGVACYALGKIGYKIFRWSIAAWVVCLFAGTVVLMLAYRIAQIAVYAIDSKFWATICSLISLVVGIGLLFGIFALAKIIINNLAGGRAGADVDGRTRSDVTNKVDTDTTITNEPRVEINGSSSERVEVTESTTVDPSGDVDQSPSVGERVIVAGGIVLGHPEVAAGLNAIQNRNPITERPASRRDVPELNTTQQSAQKG